MSTSGSGIVAQGGNLVPASTIGAQGGGNFRNVMAAGEKIVQFPGKGVKLK